jgi:hypothetical protein
MIMGKYWSNWVLGLVRTMIKASEVKAWDVERDVVCWRRALIEYAVKTVNPDSIFGRFALMDTSELLRNSV